MEIRKVPIGELKENEKNPRFIKEEKFKKLMASIESFPKMLELRPIVVNEKNVILGGNMRYRAARELGIKEIPVMNVADLTPEQQKEFIIKDNLPYGEWDWDVLANEWGEQQLSDWGLDGVWVEPEPEEDEDERYTKKIKSPVYEPKEEKPKPELLFDDEKCKELIKEIDESDVPEVDKLFLRMAAMRHVVFDYQRIAEYYAHSSKDVQELMENSALVIIDFDKAIELGYVRLTEDMADQYSSDLEAYE